MNRRKRSGWFSLLILVCLWLVAMFTTASPVLAKASSPTSERFYQAGIRGPSIAREVPISTARAKQLALEFIGPEVVTHMLHRVSPMNPQPNLHVKFSTSTNWSGYYTDTSKKKGKPLVDVSQAFFSVPNEKVSDTLTGTWVGIGGVNGGNLAQTGVAIGGGMSQAWYELFPAPPVYVNVNVSANDEMTGNVSLDKESGAWYFLILDLTNNSYYASEFSFNPDQTTSDWILEVPGGQGPVPKIMGKVTFSRSMWADNAGNFFLPINNSEGQDVAVTLNDPQGGNICPSNLTGHGENFNLMTC
jgi:hypothetical protein